MRRARVLARINQSAPLTAKSMEDMLRYFAQNVEVNENFKDSKFEVKFSTDDKFNITLKDILDIINQSKPCFLDYDIALQYKGTQSNKVETKQYLYNLPNNGCFAGTLPEPITTARSQKTSMSTKVRFEIKECDYIIPLCGTVPYVLIDGVKYKAKTKITPTNNIKEYSYIRPQCGTVPYNFTDVKYAKTSIKLNGASTNIDNSYPVASEKSFIIKTN